MSFLVYNIECGDYSGTLIVQSTELPFRRIKDEKITVEKYGLFQNY